MVHHTEGDLIQADRTKVDLIDNVGLSKDKLVWEFFSSMRFSNIHVVRFRWEPLTAYESRNDSFAKVRFFQAGYDLDFYMCPQLLFGANWDLNVTNFNTDLRDVVVAGNLYNYHDNQTLTIPSLACTARFTPY